jgi:acetyl esterase/lipase
LTLPPPAADVRIPYGTDPHQFGDLRLPKGQGPHPVVMNIHGGFWRNKYDLAHAGHLCAALTARGSATWNVEYRRVGDEGGGWPGSFADIRNAYRFVAHIPQRYRLDAGNIVVIGHSAGGQLALCLAAHETAVKAVVSLAGVVDLQRAWELHLSHDAVAEFMGGSPEQVPEHYAEADPMRLEAPRSARQWLVHGDVDDVVPVEISRNYYQRKRKSEIVELLEIKKAGHFDVIDPRSAAWTMIEQVVLRLTVKSSPPQRQ